MTSKVSIVDIATMAGVSTATVSRVLNKNGRYSKGTEEKVLALVEEYGYTPNINAKNLRINKTLTVGVIVPNIANEFFGRLVRSIENSLLPQGYSVFVCDSHENEDHENLCMQSLIAKCVDGIICISGKTHDMENGMVNHIPIVNIDRYPDNAKTIVQSENLKGGFLAAQELIQKGCKRIAILQDFHRMSTIRQRLAGFVEAHNKYGVTFYDDLILEEVETYEIARKRVKDLIDRRIKLDGVFATNDMLALGALHGLRDAGKSCPEDIKIVGFDGVSIAEFCDPPLSTIRQDTEQMGALAVEGLMRRMRGDREGLVNFTVPVELVIRHST